MHYILYAKPKSLKFLPHTIQHSPPTTGLQHTLNHGINILPPVPPPLTNNPPKPQIILILIGVDGAEREVLRLRLRLGQHVEEGGLADVGQANDADPKVGAHPADQGLLLRSCGLLWRHSGGGLGCRREGGGGGVKMG